MKATARALIGRTITAVDFRPFWTESGIAHDPVLTLDNGRRIFFVTEETGHGEYPTLICITDKGRKQGRQQ